MRIRTSPPDGIRDVYVNGRAVLRDAALTGVRSGRVLRNGGNFPRTRALHRGLLRVAPNTITLLQPHAVPFTRLP